MSFTERVFVCTTKAGCVRYIAETTDGDIVWQGQGPTITEALLEAQMYRILYLEQVGELRDQLKRSDNHGT